MEEGTHTQGGSMEDLATRLERRAAERAAAMTDADAEASIARRRQRGEAALERMETSVRAIEAILASTTPEEARDRLIDIDPAGAELLGIRRTR
jgi:hypothetical protein